MKYFALIFCVVFLFSCKSNGPDTDPSIIPEKKSSVQNNEAVSAASTPVLTPTPAPVTQAVSSGTTQSSNAGINPAHGAPGHRCDIPVGAPLNSPVKSPVAGITQMPAPAQMTTPASAPVVTKAGMNPPHGQPGHRCDISVGAPLNSKPATTVVPASATTVSSVPVPSTAPAKILAEDGKIANPVPVSPQK